MDGQTSGTTEPNENQVPVDPWIAAFEALEPKSEETPAADAQATAELGGTDTDAESIDGEDSTQIESGDSTSNEDAFGGLDTSIGVDTGESGTSSGSVFSGIEDIDIEKYENSINADLRARTIKDISDDFIERGVRNHNGKLGATLDDDDICIRDDDGVPHFYNPETGQEFRGDNPRRQAQEWVDDYNRELARVFNEACKIHEDDLRKQVEPSLAVIRFAPKYDKLDDIRRGMLDNIIEDYEVTDNNGKVIGYSCDLDKALNMVDRQIKMIQDYAKTQQPAQKPAPTGPALDMKTSSGAVQAGDNTPPSSLAEAMERLQDAQLDKLKK